MYNENNTTYKTIKSFTDLNAWREGHKLVLVIYQLTEYFPAKERFGLVNQIQRAAVSITSNIAEGFSRHSNKEKAQFYFMALGSLSEVQNQLIIARDLKYITPEQFNMASIQTITVHKLTNGIIKSSRTLRN